MQNSRHIRRLLILGLLALLFAAAAPSGYAHPMGNFSISHYSGIRLSNGSVELRYIIDMAEIPTYQEMQASKFTPTEGDPSLAAYLKREATSLMKGIIFEVNGKPVELQLVSDSVLCPPGAGGLPTMKMGFLYRGKFEQAQTGAANQLQYRDNNFPGHAGWKEIVLTTEKDVRLDGTSTFAADRSHQLSNYPTDLINSPPQDTEIGFSFRLAASAQQLLKLSNSVPNHSKEPLGRAVAPLASSPNTPPLHNSFEQPQPSKAIEPGAASLPITPPADTLHLKANQQSTPRSRFTDLVTSRTMSFWFLVTAAFIAMGLGALHALEPGHGKTVVGAYLVGSRGSARHAVFLGLLVTGSHTAGVYLLGAITLYASRYIVPEQIYPWLAVVSGLMVAVLAIYLLLRAWTGESGNHSHAPGESHNQWLVVIRRRFSKPGRIDDFPQVLPAETTAVREQISLKQLLVLGITGGIVPCPAALVVLLSALSLHRTGFGLFLIVCFSFGLAAVLIVIGLLMVYSRKLVARWKGDSVWITRWLPLASAGFMLVLGVTIAGRALLTMGIHPSAIAHGRIGSLLAIVALGLFLGMRHSTDADHVVAVSTIVSRERSMSQGALIGMLWGFGHTLTIFLVGAAIILFRIVIPPRVGLSMEFAVAAMLILLGVLNLTGTLRRVTNRLTPPAGGVTAEVAAPQGCDAASSSRPWTKLTRKFGWYQLLRPLAIGLVHGLAGSAAVALLVLSMIPNPVWAICYLLVFGFGTVLGMMIMTWAISIPIAYTGNRLARTTGYLTTISGLVSVAFGIFLVYHIGFVDGLFTSHVHWTPE